MKTVNCLMLSLVVVFVLSGCSFVTSLNPVGTNPIQIQEDDWEGVWCSKAKGVFFISVKDKDKGILRIAVVEKMDKEEDFTLLKYDVQLRQGKSSVFGNILFEEIIKELEKHVKEIVREKEEIETNELIGKTYLWFMIENVGDSIVIHEPNYYNFDKLVEEEKLKGKYIPTGTFWPPYIVICEPTDKITEFIDSNDDSGKLFQWKSPWTLRRIKKGIP